MSPSGTAIAGQRPSLVTGPFVSLAAATLAFYIAGGLILPVTPRFVETSLGSGTFEVGIVFASYAIASLLLRPIVGWSSDRFGRRPLLVGGTLLTVAGMLLHLVATDLTVLITARSLLGGGRGVLPCGSPRRGERPCAGGSSRGGAELPVPVALSRDRDGPFIGETLLGRGDFTLV